MTTGFSQKASIFLSHSSQDKKFVRKLAEDLRQLDTIVWLDEAEMLPGDNLVDHISNTITEIDYLAVVLSPNSVGSCWVKYEMELAMHDEIAGRRVRVIPILKENCDIPPFLRGKIWADLSEPDRYMDGVLKIAKQVRRIVEERTNEERERLIERTTGVTLTCTKAGGMSKLSARVSDKPYAVIDGEKRILAWHKLEFIKLRPQEGHCIEVYVPAYGIHSWRLGRASMEVFVNVGERKDYVYRFPYVPFAEGTLTRVN
jgi:hypothetical protein